MEEVVAKRHNAAGAAYIFVILVGLLMVIIGCIVGIGNEENGAGVLVITLSVGGLILAMGIFYTVRFFRLPAKVVVLRDGVLYFPRKVSCRPEELEKVFIRIYKNARSGAVSKYGKLEVTIGGKVYKYTDIARVSDVQTRLLELNRQAIDALVRPAEEASAVNADNTTEETSAVSAESAPADEPFAE